MAILDKFHIIRKAVALIQLFSCIIVFTFSLILLIIGSITVATANSTNDEFYQTTDYVSGGNLLIVSGIFGIIISIIGALGAVPCLFDRQDNWNLWIGLIVLIIYILVLVGIFIFEISAAGWAYSKWDTVSLYLQEQLVEDIQINYGIGNMGYTASVDSVQQELMCCGINGVDDWDESEWKMEIKINDNDRLPPSCCGEAGSSTTVMPTSNMTVAPTNMTAASTNTTVAPTNMTASTNATVRRRRELIRRDVQTNSSNTTMQTTTAMPVVICKTNYEHAFRTGCWDKISNALNTYTFQIGGVTIALAIIQILIILVPIILLVIVIVELRRSKSMSIK
ncbi:CD9 antigen-like [Oopsacas minuta]|uniref:CD9 antigen-like n=1 Tax=Oopsacas minuta TaxID=111878 RepID=A0AAV7JFU2_9METZ|nr:CD9 antigen-like [Oopsacas minuta]